MSLLCPCPASGSVSCQQNTQPGIKSPGDGKQFVCRVVHSFFSLWGQVLVDTLRTFSAVPEPCFIVTNVPFCPVLKVWLQVLSSIGINIEFCFRYLKEAPKDLLTRAGSNFIWSTCSQHLLFPPHLLKVKLEQNQAFCLFLFLVIVRVKTLLLYSFFPGKGQSVRIIALHDSGLKNRKDKTN